MADTDLIARLRLDNDQFVRGLRTSTREAERSSRQMEQSLGGVSRGFGTLTRSVQVFGTALAAVGLAEFSRQAITTATAMEALDISFKAATGSAEDGAETLEFLREETDRLGLRFLSTAESARGLFGALEGTSLEGEQTRQIFLGVAEAAAAMRLSQEQVSGTIQALSQIASKGVVSMEELRQQLAERIPQATRILARELGVTTAELNEMVESGNLLATTALPALARGFRREFGPAAEEAANTFQAATNRLLSAFDTLLARMGQVITQSPLVIGALGAIAAGMEAITPPTSEAEKEIRQLERAIAELRRQGAIGSEGMIAEMEARIRAIREEEAVRERQASAIANVRKEEERLRNEQRAATEQSALLAEQAEKRLQAEEKVARAAVNAARRRANELAALAREQAQLDEQRAREAVDMFRQQEEAKTRIAREAAQERAEVERRFAAIVTRTSREIAQQEATRAANFDRTLGTISSLLSGLDRALQGSIGTIEGFIGSLGGALRGIGGAVSAIPGLQGAGGIIGGIGGLIGPLAGIGQSIAGLFGGGRKERQFRLRQFFARPGGSLLEFDFRRITRDQAEGIAIRISETLDALFTSLDDAVQELSPSLQDAIREPLKQLTLQFNDMGDNVQFDGSDMQREFERFMNSLSSTFRDMFGEVVAAGQEIARLRAARAQALQGFSGTRRTLEEAFMSPGQVIARRQASLQALLARFRAGSPEQQVGLGQQIRTSIEELFRLGQSSGIPGQAQALQASLLGILNEVEQTIGGNFDQQIEMQETQVTTLLNLQTIGEQQLAVLMQIANNGGVAGGGGLTLDDLVGQVRIELARQRRNGTEVF